MIKLPLVLPDSPVPFALRGDLNNSTGLLVISEGCPLTLFNAMPRNPAGETHGQLSSSWFRFIQKDKYNWAFSDILPMVGVDKLSKIYSNEALSFMPGSQLKMAWKSYSNKYWRKRVSEYLTIRSEDLCEAIALDKGDGYIIDLISPIILACEGYSIY